MPELEVASDTTSELSRDDRPVYWREQVSANQGGARVNFSSWPNFHGALKVQRLAGYQLGDFQNVQFESTAISYERTRAEIEADGDRSARLLIPRSGTLGIEQHGSRVQLKPGQMGVVDWGAGTPPDRRAGRLSGGQRDSASSRIPAAGLPGGGQIVGKHRRCQCFIVETEGVQQ